MRWPGKTKAGSSSKELVSIVDFAETFLDAAGLPVPKEMQGRSLVPILKGETPKDWRKSFYYHYYEYPAPHHVRPHYGVVTDRYKLIHYYNTDVDEWELMDLQKDHSKPRASTTIRLCGYGQGIEERTGRLRRELKDTAAPPREAYGNQPF